MSEPDFDFGLEFRSAAERIKGERERREALVARKLSFHVKFLDDALGGILPNDLVMLGARTGVGKTALASMIAQGNALAKKHVHYFALEAEDDEIERRIKYRLLVLIFNAKEAPPAIHERGYDAARWRDFAEKCSRLSYRNWYMGEVNDVLGKYEPQADAMFEKYETLHTYYRGRNFDLDELDRTFLAYRDQSALFVLDHLHYVDSDDPNENRAMKEITKHVRDMSLSSGVPVLVIAHLRKKDRGGPRRLVPDIDEFHGASDITKIATKVLLIAPAYTEGGPAHQWGTYMQCVKDRMDGSVVRFCALVDYDVRFSNYADSYKLGTLDALGTQFTDVDPAEAPFWARRDRTPALRLVPPSAPPANDTREDADDTGCSQWDAPFPEEDPDA